jgi:hypothetical protein
VCAAGAAAALLSGPSVQRARAAPAAALAGPGATLPADPGLAPLAGPGAVPLVPFVVGGSEASISRFPWQVFVEGRFEEGGRRYTTSCGGSILDATHILTAAHCVDAEGTTQQHSAGAFLIASGTSNLDEPSATTQVRRVASIRTHPYYAVSPEMKDDAAVLALEKPLELSEAANAEPISLVPAGATPAPGTTLSLSGYGKEEGAEGAQPDGRLHSTTLTAIGSDACRSQVKLNSAVLLCAESPSSSGCQGDSGGPLTQGSPAVEVGIVDFGAKECPVAHPNVFTNIAAPEIRDFIEGSETPPVAPRQLSPPAMRWFGSAPADFIPLTCEAGVWSGSPVLTYAFRLEGGSPQTLQSAPGNVFVPQSGLLGATVVCVVQAANAGGVSTGRSEATPAIVADIVPPNAAITALRCRRRSCVLSFAAWDPNGLAVRARPTVSYAVAGRCRRRGGSRALGRRGASGRRGCRRTRTLRMRSRALSAGSFRARASRLPYDERITFTVAVSNVAGLKARIVSAHTTLGKRKRKRRRRTT